MATLLERAMSNPARKGVDGEVTHEQIDLVIGYLNGQVNLTQVAVALEQKSHAHAQYKVFSLLRDAYRAGLVDVIKK